ASFVRSWPGERIGVVGGPGDRRDEDFVQLGKLAAQMFDRIIVKEDDDNRGRERGDGARLIIEGIKLAKPDFNYEIILDETEAINTALDNATVNSLVVVLPESVSRAVSLIEARNPIPDAVQQPSTVESNNAVTSSVGN
ncbi:MAG TPA: cyanophycin synthetase, partial [Phormidium sp.]